MPKGFVATWQSPVAKEDALNIFKTFALKWWQGALFKWGVLALGIAVGACWHDFFSGSLPLLIILSAISLSYITYVWWRQ